MINKRPYGDEDSYEVASKHPRECSYEVAPVVDIVTFQNDPQKSFSVDEGKSSFEKCRDERKFTSDLITDVSKESREAENGLSGGTSHYLWVNSNIIEADLRLETASHLSLFPEFFEHGDRLRVLLQSDDIYASSSVDYPPQKLVAVGPEHQACVPEWHPRGSNSSDCQTDLQMLNADEEKMGICVFPMPKPDVSLNYCSEDDGVSRNECRCLDGGSVRCVRQHVMEAREKLREKMGSKLFEELGFCEMGEDVAKQWTEEEEQIFHEVVLSNPASLGKNFWDHLPVAFPSRTHKDLVSYYFNVFMLRKRAEQNRFDPLNIDSDNDEWQQSELAVVEDDEDSVVESPIDQDAPYYCQEEHLEDCHEDLDDANKVDACEGGVDLVCQVGADEEDGGDIDDGSEAFAKDSPGNFCDTKIDVLGKTPGNNRGDIDVQDYSCTSYECQRNRIELCCPLDDGNLSSNARDCSVG
ncbi:uncharacterized protein LOC21403871 [Morus notabilis]|uniref:uncharacterized protein LOC21403871 n=1 Tax=Morus notabilis TaxID=981085 RepID=UPI000CED3E7B|nr:uncharacterized protein LOC21403871 [Morus notabilis]XP_024016896.1 uncharacterized protein LOC21403871 [Morus notabilis]